MKPWHLSLGMAVLLCGLAQSQEQPQVATEPSLEPSAWVQRRAEADEAFAHDKTACYKQFAVNACLNHARQKRSLVIEDVKRQEQALHQAERQSKAVRQLQKQEEKSSLETLQAAVEQREQKVVAAHNKQAAMDQKAQEKSTVPETAHLRQRAYAEKEVQKTRDRSAAVAKNQDFAQKSSSFDQKQRDAVAHQADVEQTHRTRTKPLAAPLPDFGAMPTPLAPRLAGP
jgi:sulfur carrier protein ThiS